MKVSMHNGRSGSATHNDRSFLKNWSKDEILEKAPHIDTTKTHLNCFYQPKELSNLNYTNDLITYELEAYKQLFNDSLNSVNERYIQQSHPERCKTIEDWYTNAKTRPEEQILQVGDMYDDIDPEVFKGMVREYMGALMDWSKRNGYPVTVLDCTVHLDEGSPHAHLRRVFHYKDDNGNLRIGQNKALERAGIELPDKTKKSGRDNNLKMTFDKMCRELWQDIAISRGFNIDKEPRLNIRHKDKKEYINDQLALQEEIFKLNDEAIKKASQNVPGAFKKLLNKLGVELVTPQYLEALKLNSERLKVIEKELNDLKSNPNKLKQKALNEITVDKAKTLEQSKTIIARAEREASDILKQANFDVQEFTRLQHFQRKYEKLKKRYPQQFKEIEQLEKSRKRDDISRS